MSTPPAGIPDADWLLWPPEARQFILAQQQEIEQLRSQLAALATELASLREQIGRSSRNSTKPPSSDGPGFKPPARRKGSGRKRGGQPGHPGSGPELLPIERVDEVVEHHPDAFRCCGTARCQLHCRRVDSCELLPCKRPMSMRPAPLPATPTAIIPLASGLAEGHGHRCGDDVYTRP
jgi:transposase